MSYQIVDAAFVLENLHTMPIVDVRPRSLYDQSRIPGARSVEMMAVKQLGGDTATELASRMQALGIGPHDACIIYCQHGILAAEACEYLEEAGYDNLHSYKGSFTDWITDPTRPVEH